MDREDWRALKVDRETTQIVVFNGVVIGSSCFSSPLLSLSLSLWLMYACSFVVENLLHVAPSECTSAIFQNLSAASPLGLLDKQAGWIAIYGAFIEDGKFFSDSDRAVCSFPFAYLSSTLAR